MTWGYPALALIALLAGLLLWAGIEDAHHRTIANWKNAAIALLAPAWWWASGPMPLVEIGIQVAVAVVVFAIFIGTFAAGWMGGGDVKMIGALALWLPLQALMWMLVAMSVMGGVLTIVMLIDRHIAKREGPVEVPYGIAIAAATILTISEPVFNHLP